MQISRIDRYASHPSFIIYITDTGLLARLSGNCRLPKRITYRVATAYRCSRAKYFFTALCLIETRIKEAENGSMADDMKVRFVISIGNELRNSQDRSFDSIDTPAFNCHRTKMQRIGQMLHILLDVTPAYSSVCCRRYARYYSSMIGRHRVSFEIIAYGTLFVYSLFPEPGISSGYFAFYFEHAFVLIFF